MNDMLFHCRTGAWKQKNIALLVVFGVPVSILCNQSLPIGVARVLLRVLAASLELPHVFASRQSPSAIIPQAAICDVHGTLGMKCFWVAEGFRTYPYHLEALGKFVDRPIPNPCP
jgi:hypothetical protein